MDAFIQAVEDARHRLSRQEGSTVSVRELLRRAGFDESQRAGVAYHLNPNRHDGSKPHRVPAETVRRLAEVLRPAISHDELQRAAQTAAGFNVADQGDPAVVVQRYLGDENVSEEEKQAVTARLLEIIATETRRGRPAATGGDVIR